MAVLAGVAAQEQQCTTMPGGATICVDKPTRPGPRGGGGGGGDRERPRRQESGDDVDEGLRQAQSAAAGWDRAAEDALAKRDYDNAIRFLKKALNAYFTKPRDQAYHDRIKRIERQRDLDKAAARAAAKAEKESRARAERDRKIADRLAKDRRAQEERDARVSAKRDQAAREQAEREARARLELERRRALETPPTPPPPAAVALVTPQLPVWAPGSPIETIPAASSDQPFIVRWANRVLVGGTGWVAGYYVPPGRIELTDEARRMFEKQFGIDGRSFDPAGYDMVIGVASSYSFIGDLASRVIGLPFHESDQNTDGGFSARAQPLYASLKGTATDLLDCHSNGAMVCLEALSRGHVVGKTGKPNVRLFGPQLTPSALKEWQRLLNEGTIGSLEINLVKGDPVGPASFSFGDSPFRDTAIGLTPGLGTTLAIAKTLAFGGDMRNTLRATGAISHVPQFWMASGAETLRDEIRRAAPGVEVKVFDSPGCQWQGFVGCHDMKNYQRLRDGVVKPVLAEQLIPKWDVKLTPAPLY